MSHPKTYFILPTTAYAPDDFVQLGQVIVDPRVPYRRLAEPLKLQGKLVPRKATTVDWDVSQTETHDANSSVFAYVYHILNAEASAKGSKRETNTWKGAQLDTHFIELDEDPSYVQSTAKEVSAVSTWLKANNRLLGRTVYMITGIKVASKSGEGSHDTAITRDVSAKAEAAVNLEGGAPLKVGAEAGSQDSDEIHMKGTPQDSFVFAYQLRKLHVSWRSKVSVGEYVEGADLHGVSEGQHPRDTLPDRSSGRDEDYEIDEVTYEDKDFGNTLPKKDVKKRATDDLDGSECIVIQAVME